MNDRLRAPNPGGLCICGCGQVTTIAKQSSTERGWVKGESVSYIRGHAPRITGHKITQVNPDQRTAICSTCGPTGIKKNGSGAWKCLRGLPSGYALAHGLTEVDEDALTAICRQCGPVSISRMSTGRWKCLVLNRQDQTLYRKRHPERIKAKNKEWYVANVDHRREYHLLTKYGIASIDYDEMLADQGGVCAICQGAPSGPGSGNGIFHVDHDHGTGRVRGLLCWSCNAALGGFGDDTIRLQRAIDYLLSALPAGVCEVCLLPDPEGKPLRVDHDRNTGRVRGLLCRSCNTALGLLGEDPVRFQRAMDYMFASLAKVSTPEVSTPEVETAPGDRARTADRPATSR